MNQLANDIRAVSELSIGIPEKSPQQRSRWGRGRLGAGGDGGGGKKLNAAERQELETYRKACDALQDVIARAASGDMEARILRLESYGEVGPMLSSINDLLDLTDAYLRESMATMEAAQENRFYRRFFARGMLGSFGEGAKVIDGARLKMTEDAAEKKQQRLEVADQFEKQTQGVVMALADSVAGLRRNSKELRVAADETLQKAEVLNRESEVSGESVRSVASASEELSSAVAEVSTRMNDVQSRSSKAAESAADAGQAITQLTDGISEIEKVVEMIQRVAGQTRLLALNATIEAARAGEAGKGFAVVASEVKDLAAQTASATDTISASIADFVGNIESVVQRISTIAEDVSETQILATDVAGATEEQNAAVGEINRSMQVAASSVNSVDEAVSNVGQSARTVEKTSGEVDTIVKDIDERCGELRTAIDRFTGFLRSDD